MAEEEKEITGDIVIKALPDIQPPAEETFEQKEERLKREDYIRRNAQAVKDREDILRRNGVIAADEPFSMDTEAALRLRCCP